MRLFPFLLGLVLALVAGAWIVPSTRGAVAAAATPTPTPVALQYDEISRIITAPATPPVPGSFSDDYQLAMSATSAQAQPTPAPHHGLSSVLSNMVPPMGGAPSGAPPGAMGMMNLMRTGHLMRYTFYYTKGWIREDDPVAQVAIISKCNEHIFITLDFAKKIYTQTSAQASNANCFQMPGMGGPSVRGGAPTNAQPGTEDLTIDAKAQNLGPKTIDGIATIGSSADVSMATTNATGSCQNSSMNMSTVRYVSNIGKPRAYCPLSAAPAVATDPAQVAAQGGCKPTIHGSPAYVSFNDNKLEMYYLMSMNQRGRDFGMLTERGHVAWLYRAQADPLFEVPAGFTESQ